MYIREDQLTSAVGVLEASPVELLEISDDKKREIKNYYIEHILKNCESYSRTVHYENDRVRIITKLSYPAIEQFDEDLIHYKEFFLKTTGISIIEMLERTGYTNQLLYEDIV